MDPDKENIDYYSRMDRPIPGEGLTTDPKTPYPWEQPPKFTSVIQASEYIFDQLVSEELHTTILDAMEEDVPVMDLTRYILFQGFTEGLWNPDLLLLLVEPTAYIFVALAERALIDPVVYKEEDEDDIALAAETVVTKEGLNQLKIYSVEEGLPENALSEELKQKIAELPEGRKSLLEKPETTEETSLLRRTG